MLTYVGFYVDGIGRIGTTIRIDKSTPVPELIIKDLQDLIER